jgi:hypothetical protein
MFTNHTLLSLYADARHADDLRALRQGVLRTGLRGSSWLARLFPRPLIVAPQPVIAGR